MQNTLKLQSVCIPNVAIPLYSDLQTALPVTFFFPFPKEKQQKQKTAKKSCSEQTGIVYSCYVISLFLSFPVGFFLQEAHIRYQCGLTLILWASDSKRSSVLGFVSPGHRGGNLKLEKNPLNILWVCTEAFKLQIQMVRSIKFVTPGRVFIVHLKFF